MDDAMPIFNNCPSGRPTFLPVTIETTLGSTSFRAGVGAMVVKLEAIVVGQFLVVPRTTRFLDQKTTQRCSFEMSSRLVVLHGHLVYTLK